MKEGLLSEPENGKDSKSNTIIDAKAPERALESIKNEFDNMVKQWNATFVIVTNEIGSGTHADNYTSRKFVDMQGWLNQHVAQMAYQVIHMVCGIPNVIKANDTKSNLPNKQNKNEALDKYLSTRSLEMETKGYFLIKTNPEKGIILAEFHSCMINDQGEVCDLNGMKIPCGCKNRPEPYKVFEGRTAKELTVEIFERWEDVGSLVTFLSHAAYIGREAMRAEYCLESGECYLQD